MSAGLRAAVLTTALGCGLVAGSFFAFSSFIRPALNRLAPAQAIAANVPLNNALAGADRHALTAPGSWAPYMRSWTALNHVRAVASLGAVALLTVGLVAR
jgi:uncharacterized membrane protein